MNASICYVCYLNKDTVNFIIFDLEATCWNGYVPNDTQEIIEIGALCINNFGEVEKRFSAFVQPVINPSLSAYCMDLTSIQQEDVNRADGFSLVLDDFLDWIEIDDEDYLLCSWGKFDKNMLINDCQLHEMDTSWLKNHIDLKDQYRHLKNLNKAIGLQWALGKEDFEFEGTPHRAIDDAYNTAKIFVRYLDDWSY